MYVDYIVFINYTGFRYPHLHKIKNTHLGAFLFCGDGVILFFQYIISMKIKIFLPLFNVWYVVPFTWNKIKFFKI